jgi:hypothetical protein
MQAQQNMAVRPLDDAEKALMDAEKQDWFMNMGGLPSLSMPSMNALGEFPKLDLGSFAIFVVIVACNIHEVIRAL